MHTKVYEQLSSLLHNLTEEDKQLHYDVLHKIFSDKDVLHHLLRTDKELIDKIKHLYHYGFLTSVNKKKLMSILSTVKEEIKNDASLKELDVKVLILERLLQQEIEYLDYVPGAANKEYVRLSDLLRSKQKKLVIDKEELALQGGNLNYAGKLIQGCNIRQAGFGVTVLLSAEHYTDVDSLKQEIYHGLRLVSSKHRQFNIGNDPYCYLVEAGKLNNKSPKEIKKILGAADADAGITVQVQVPAEHVWVRVKRGAPAKFAIEAHEVPFSAPKPQKGYRVIVHGEVEFWAA